MLILFKQTPQFPQNSNPFLFPQKMGQFLTLLTYLHSLAGPTLMLLYPLCASIHAIETPSKLDDEQWLSYWILYSFLTLFEMVAQPMLARIGIWYEIKLAMVAWMVLPYFRGAAFIYDKLVREQLKKFGEVKAVNGGVDHHKTSPSKEKKRRFLSFVTPKKGDQEIY